MVVDDSVHVRIQLLRSSDFGWILSGIGTSQGIGVTVPAPAATSLCEAALVRNGCELTDGLVFALGNAVY